MPPTKSTTASSCPPTCPRTYTASSVVVYGQDKQPLVPHYEVVRELDLEIEVEGEGYSFGHQEHYLAAFADFPSLTEALSSILLGWGALGDLQNPLNNLARFAREAFALPVVVDPQAVQSGAEHAIAAYLSGEMSGFEGNGQEAGQNILRPIAITLMPEQFLARRGNGLNEGRPRPPTLYA
ncbi:hypothetical protein [Deinococcus hopiensis]|uniref:Uncharacterized protein n=1 Tax=Deinococcus hopiensis KR-140 TaxID=695939 RepID=A0A1W1UDX3_9DEIO|nr:hypothetical protein [Deinococcus hopiensis]SMB78984.1 hypothetical protein SAMN00790413_05713 [Deinococcus hopiensis KR-140]